jgi:hypothetical protein
MIYRGVEYRMVQCIAPKGWRWTFEYAGRQRSGHKSHREEAIMHMKRSIDQAIRRYDESPSGSQTRPARGLRKLVTVPAGSLVHPPKERCPDSPAD